MLGFVVNCRMRFGKLPPGAGEIPSPHDVQIDLIEHMGFSRQQVTRQTLGDIYNAPEGWTVVCWPG